MQTFLPYPNFISSAKSLDYRRLGKQRVEAYQILKTLKEEGKRGWRNHPAVIMWKGYEDALAVYMNACIIEWTTRGYNNNMQLANVTANEVTFPPWFGHEDFHASHRSNLLRKDPVFYGKYGWLEPSNLPYVWPVQR